MKIHFTSYITIVLLALALGSCNIMDDSPCTDEPASAGTPVQVGFTLTTGEVSSRAITEGEQAGTGYENYIDVEGNDFRILLFNATDDTYLTTFEPTIIRATDNSQYPQTYYVEGELPEAYSNFKLVVLANWGTYPTVSENSTIESVCTDAASVYNYTAGFTPSAENKIPMYGVHTYTNIQFRADLLTTLPEEVDLLRAMAKIEVKCNESLEDITLTGVTLHHYNTSGMCAPEGIYGNTTDWDVDTGTDCSHEIHLPENVTQGESLPFNKVGESYIIGEYNNEGTLIENTDFDIVRNHWYTYTINNVDDGKLIFQYRVKKWNVEASQIGWNATATLAAWNSKSPKEPNLTDATVGDEEAVLCYVINPRYNSAHDGLEAKKSSYAGFYFQLKEPKGAVWKAHLSDPNFRFGTGKYDFEGTDDKFCASTGIAREEPYQIQIMAPNSWTEGSGFNGELTSWGREHNGQEIKTKFWITISLDGVNEYPLIINPVIEDLKTHYNTGRRFAGDNDYEIVLWQLKALETPNDFIELLEHYNYNEWWKN